MASSNPMEKRIRLVLALSILILGGLITWFNIYQQQTLIDVNRRGIEVTGTVSFKRQVYRSSGRGSSYVNAFTVYYFEKVPDEVREPVTLEAFGKTIELGKGGPYIGDFYAYDIENISNAVYNSTSEGDSIALVYLPGKPEKVWLKEAVANKTHINLFWPFGIIGSSLFLAIITTRLRSSRFLSE